MPVVGEVTYSRGDASSYETGLWSYSDRSKEVVTPGYYRTHLSRYNVDVELTATKRVGFHKYTFLGNESPAIVFDMVNGGCWDKTTEAVIRVVNDSTVSGYRYSKGWADDQRVFFRAEFSRKFDNVEFIVNDSVKEGDMAKGAQLFARVNFAAGNQEPVYMKVLISHPLKTSKEHLLQLYLCFRSASYSFLFVFSLHSPNLHVKNSYEYKIFHSISSL